MRNLSQMHSLSWQICHLVSLDNNIMLTGSLGNKMLQRGRGKCEEHTATDLAEYYRQ